MKTLARITATTVVAAAALAVTTVGLAVPASAADDDNFGQHVRTCVQTIGFSGSHNPGMHHGAAGWDGMPCMYI
jgi:hypothetical protein